MKKMLPWLITLLLAIVLIAVVAIFLFNQFFNNALSSDAERAASSVNQIEAQRLSASEVVDVTSEISDIRTNLADTDFVVIVNFAFQLDSKKSREDFDKIKDLQVKPIIIRTLADLNPEDIKGSQGKDALSARLLNEINPILPGKARLNGVEITNFMITRI